MPPHIAIHFHAIIDHAGEAASTGYRAANGEFHPQKAMAGSFRCCGFGSLIGGRFRSSAIMLRAIKLLNGRRKANAVETWLVNAVPRKLASVGGYTCAECEPLYEKWESFLIEYNITSKSIRSEEQWDEISRDFYQLFF